MGTPHCEVRIRLVGVDGQPFMGIGVLWLLEAIARSGSLRQAALTMALSYPKALRMVRAIEQQVGRAVVERRKGGREHGGASLTPFGQEFVAAYRGLCDQLQETAAAEYERRLGPLLRPVGEERGMRNEE